MEKKVKDMKKGKDDSKENYDFSDIEKNSQDEFVVGAIGIVPDTPSFEPELPDLCNTSTTSNMSIVKDTAGKNLQTIALDKLETGPTDATKSVEKDNEISPCVVCHKKFKSRSCMNKHLRSVHAGLLIYFFKLFLLF